MSYGKRQDGFDSKLEAKVYRYLLRYFPQQHCHLHQALEVRPATRHFSQPRMWKPDIIVSTLPPEHDLFLESIYLIVEVKGRWILKPHAGLSFRLLLELVSSFSPRTLDKLIIVSQDEFQVAGLNINAYKPAIEKAHRLLNDQR